MKNDYLTTLISVVTISHVWHSVDEYKERDELAIVTKSVSYILQ